MNRFIPRNPFAHSPLMRKGGAHQRSNSSARFAGKQAMLAELDDWQEEWPALDTDTDTSQGTAEKPGCGPVFLWLQQTAADQPIRRATNSSICARVHTGFMNTAFSPAM